MSEAAKAARAANKAKAKRLADGDPKAKVDASSWTPPEMMNTEKKTGLRPVSRRAYKRGGKVHGEEAPQNAGRKARKSNNMPTATAIANAKVNRNVKHANAEEFGQPHIGGYANGGYAKGGRPGKAGGGSMEDKPSLRLVKSFQHPSGRMAKVYKDKDYGEYRTKFFDEDGKHMPKADYHTDDKDDAHDTAESFLEGRTGKMGGGSMGDPRAAAADRMAAANQQSGVPSGRMSFVERQGTPLPGSGMKKGGRAKKADGGMSAGDVHAMTGKYGAPADDMGRRDAGMKAYQARQDKLEKAAAAQKAVANARNAMATPRDAGGSRRRGSTVSPGEMQEQPKASMGMSPMRTTPPLPGEEMRRGGKTKKWEGSAKDEMQDKKLAKKRGMSMKAWEASEGDKKHDKQQSMAGLKKGGRAAKADGGKMDPRNAGGGGGGPSGNDLMHAMVPLTMLMKKGGRVGKAGGGAMDGNYTGGTRPTGGRIAKASGGLLSSLMGGSKASGSKGKSKKKGTNINIVINAGQKPEDPMAGLPMLPPGKPPMLPPAMSAGAPAPAGGPPMPPPDMGGGAPGGGLGAMLGRKAGGRVGHRNYSSYKDMDAGAGSGLGRLEKTEIAKKTYRK
jgi:hypothetical protein